MTDLELVRLVVTREAAALAALYDRYAAQVNGLALSILHDTELSEEVTHDVFLRVWEQPLAFDATRGTFAGWLFRVARNRAIDLHRRRRDAPLGDPEVSPVSWLADPAPSPEDQTVASIHRQEVRRALDDLPPDQRTLLELAYYTGLTQREIAERLGRPLGTVKSQIRAAMQRLATLLAASDTPPNEST